MEYNDEVRFLQAQTDHIEQLAKYRGRSCPTFLFYMNGDLVKVIRGADSPHLEATIKEQIELQKMGVERTPYQEDDTVDTTARIEVAEEVDDDVSEPVPLSKLRGRSQIALSIVGSRALANLAEGDTLAIIKPDCSPRMIQAIRDYIKAGLFTIAREKRVWFTVKKVNEFYQEHRAEPFFDELVRFMTSAPCLALHLHRENAVQAWRTLIGPTNSDLARDTAPNSIRAFAGTDGTRNAVHGSDSIASAERELELLFGNASDVELPRIPISLEDSTPTTLQKEYTLVIVKPDAVSANKDAEILDIVRARGYDILQQEKIELSADRAKEFYREHEGKPFFNDLVQFMSGSPIVVAAIKGDNVIRGWREMIGPTNTAIAKIERPMSIRARFGTDGTKNAVHGSDSPTSVYREIEFFFPEIVKSENMTPPPPKPERTLALIKPDAMSKGHKDAILQLVRDAGFTIVEEKQLTQKREIANAFYMEHFGKGFYEDLTEWMSSAPIYAMVLEKENAVKAWRELAGPTNSEKAREISPKSIRALYGEDGSHNAVHGSDSLASAAREIDLLFGKTANDEPAEIDTNDSLLRIEEHPNGLTTENPSSLKGSQNLAASHRSINEDRRGSHASIREPSTDAKRASISLSKSRQSSNALEAGGDIHKSHGKLVSVQRGSNSQLLSAKNSDPGSQRSLSKKAPSTSQLTTAPISGSRPASSQNQRLSRAGSQKLSNGESATTTSQRHLNVPLSAQKKTASKQQINTEPAMRASQLNLSSAKKSLSKQQLADTRGSKSSLSKEATEDRSADANPGPTTVPESASEQKSASIQQPTDVEKSSGAGGETGVSPDQNEGDERRGLAHPSAPMGEQEKTHVGVSEKSLSVHNLAGPNDVAKVDQRVAENQASDKQLAI